MVYLTKIEQLRVRRNSFVLEDGEKYCTLATASENQAESPVGRDVIQQIAISESERFCAPYLQISMCGN